MPGRPKAIGRPLVWAGGSRNNRPSAARSGPLLRSFPLNQSFLSLGWRTLWRDLRGGELRLLIVAVTLAVAALTAVGFFADRLQRGLGARGALQAQGSAHMLHCSASGTKVKAVPRLLR